MLAALRRLRASSHVEEDIEEMRAEEAASQTEAHMTMLQLVRNSNLRMPLTIGVVMQLSQQLSGINAVSTGESRAAAGAVQGVTGSVKTVSQAQSQILLLTRAAHSCLTLSSDLSAALFIKLHQ